MVIKKGNDLILKLDDITDVVKIHIYTTYVDDYIEKKDISNKINVSAKELSKLNSGVITYDAYKSKEDSSFGDDSYDTIETVVTDIYYLDTDESGAQHKKSETVEEYVDKKIDGFEQEIEEKTKEISDSVDAKVAVKAKEIADTVDSKIKVETDRATNAETTLDNKITNLTNNKADKSAIPTKTSQLTNDSGFITKVSWDDVSNKPSTFTPSSHKHTKSDITDFPINVSAFNNDKGYLTQHQDLSSYAKISAIPTKVSQLTNDSNYVTKSTADSTYAKAADLTNEVTRAKAAEENKLDKSEINNYEKKITSKESSDTAIELTPNANVDITCSGDLTITLQAPTDTSIVNVYMCTITTSGDSGTVTLPSDVTWNEEMTIEASSFYEINIRYSGGSYFGIIHKWSN